jgi:glycerate 2-kinase
VRVLIAPDDFTGTLSAAEAAHAMAAGWARAAPDDQLTLMPLSDGGPGFVSTIAAATDADIVPVGVRGPMGDTAIGMIAMVERPDVTAYVESAHGCGLALVPRERRDAGAATSYGVGQLVSAAIDAGAREIIVGLGGTASTDGGAGLLAALGATATDAAGESVPLDCGGAELRDVAHVDLREPGRRLAGIRLIAATDVESPLLGDLGAARGFAPQKGADAGTVEVLESALACWAQACGAQHLINEPGAGAAGGIGLALMLLGARRIPGFDIVRAAIDLDAVLADSDLVLTGEGSFDWQSLRGKAVTGLATAALEHGCPVVVIAGRVEVGRREYAGLGIAEAYAIGEGSGPASALALTTSRVAQQWSRPPA